MERSAFDIDIWQGNVRSDGPDGAEKHGFDVTQERLDNARRARAKLVPATREALDVDALTIYGKGWSTMRSVAVGPLPTRHFDFEHATEEDGDGVVPISSSLIPGLPSVGLTRRAVDFRDMRAGLSPHAFMGSFDETQTMIGRWFEGAKPQEVAPRNLVGEFGIP